MRLNNFGKVKFMLKKIFFALLALMFTLSANQSFAASLDKIFVDNDSQIICLDDDYDDYDDDDDDFDDDYNDDNDDDDYDDDDD